MSDQDAMAGRNVVSVRKRADTRPISPSECPACGGPLAYEPGDAACGLHAGIWICRDVGCACYLVDLPAAVWHDADGKPLGGRDLLADAVRGLTGGAYGEAAHKSASERIARGMLDQ